MTPTVPPELPIPEQMRGWVESATGGVVVSAERGGSGGSRELYFVDVACGDAPPRPLVLRLESGGGFAGTEISVAREASVYAALQGTDVPVPRLVAVAPGGEAILLERVPGTGALGTLDEPTRRQSLGSFADALGALHRVDVTTLDLPGFARPSTPEDHARLDLDRWARLAHEHVPDVDPLVRYAGAWLHARAPRRVQRTVLVQGDTGPGNFVALDGHVTGIVDWEFAHLGDPMDDLAWLEMRTGADGDAYGPLEPYLERYARASGLTVDHDAIAYYRVAVQYRCAVTTSLAVSRGGGARGWFPYVLVTQRYLLGLTDALARVTGITEPAPELPEPAVTARTSWYDQAIADVREAVRGIPEPALKEQTRNLIIPLQFLRAFDQSGPALDGLDRADMERTFGAPLGTTELAQAMEGAGARADERAFRYLTRRTRRNAMLWAALLDRRR